MKKVITYGTFDLFHEGHYRLLERAKALGDYLIVGVTTESYDKTRGKLGVVDSLMTRIENVKKTGFADEVIIEAKREGYGTDQVYRTMTVGDLIAYLEQFNENAKVYLSHDNGYTYGGITENCFK